MRLSLRLTLSLPFVLLLSTAVHAQTGAVGESRTRDSKTPTGRTMAFIENRGQWNQEARFLLRSPEADLWICRDEIRYDIHPTSRTIAPETPGKVGQRSEGRTAGHVVTMQFEGALTTAEPRGELPLQERYNYLHGNSPGRWVTDVPLYRSTRIDGLYEGVDAIFRPDHGNVRYDLTLHPGARPESIRIRYRGYDAIEVTPEGDLTLSVGGREVRNDGLYAYQQIDGTEHPVPCAFRVMGDGSVGFTLGAYDPTRTLVIDPLIHSTFLGGEGNDDGSGLAVASDGTEYVSGWSTSPNFPTTPGTYDSLQNGDYDLFVARFDAEGEELLAVTYLGGDRDDRPHAIVAAEEVGVYLCGHTDSENFPTTEGAYSRTSAGGRDGFVALFNADLTTLEYSTYIGGGDDDEALALAIGPDGAQYICGTTTSPDFPTSPDAYIHTWNNGQNDVESFVTKLSAGGTTLVYSTFLGGTSGDGANGIAVDQDGNAYVTGQTSSSDFPTTAEAFDRNSHGNTDAFATKLNGSGSDLIYSTYLGGSGDDWANAITVNSNGNAYVCGYTRSLDYPHTESAHDTTWNGNTDGFVTKLGVDGQALAFSTFIGGTQGDNVTGIALDDRSDAYICGGTYSPDFVSDGNDPNYKGGAEAFLVKLTSNGRDVTYRAILGGTDDDFAFGIVLANNGLQAYLCGTTRSSDFPTTAQAYDTSFNGFVDVFLAKLTVDDPRLGVDDHGERNGTVHCSAVPNPTTGTIRIAVELPEEDHGTVEVILFDLCGNVAGRTTADAPSTTIMELPTEDLASGVYYYRVRIDGVDRGTGTVGVIR